MTYTKEKVLIQDFTARQQANLFNQFKQNYFTGQIQVQDLRGVEYTFYLYLGRIIYATGGIHQVRRWKRLVNQYCPTIDLDNKSLSSVLFKIKPIDDLALPWEYLLLDFWVREEQITREQLVLIIRSVVSEILFDLSQSGRIKYSIKTQKTAFNPAVFIDTNQVIAGVWKLWQEWQSAKLGDCSPNMTAVLKKSEELKLRMSPETYKTMVECITNNYSLRELAVKLNRNLISLTKALLIYIQLGFIELQELPDISPPEQYLTESSPNLKKSTRKLVIGCVDDSPMVCQTLEIIFKQAGHDFISVNDELQAFATFLQCKPDLIFVDLIMPSINGYELCAGLRKLSSFRKTPIIMLTQNTKILDRLKGKIAGFNNFLSKPIHSEDVLRVVNEHILV